MATRAPKREQTPTEVLTSLNGGYNGYTDPTQTKPQMWAAATNVFSGAFNYLQRSRFANVVTTATSTQFTTLKYFALPGTGAYLLADINGKLFSYDTGSAYASTPRLNPYIDPSGGGTAQLNGPWSREALGNIVYEMNGQVKQAGRNANAATIEGFGLDAPDTSPQVIISPGSAVALTNIQRQNGTVTATSAVLPINVGVAGPTSVINITGVSDSTFNGTYVATVTGAGPYTYVWLQMGQNTALIAGSGSVTSNIAKVTGRSYIYAWENANKNHVSAPSPATQYIQYVNQNGIIQCIESGTVTLVSGSTAVVGVGTFFTSAWIGRSIWVAGVNNVVAGQRIVAVADATHLTIAAGAVASISGQVFNVYDPQATHLRLYQTADGQGTYFRVQRNAFVPTGSSLFNAALQFADLGNAEPPNQPFTTETAQVNNLPPPVGAFINEYQGRLCVFGVQGALQSFFYSNQESTSIGLQQESFAPLNQVTLPIANGKLNGMLEFPGSAILWSDKQDMFRLTGLLTDNTVTGVAQNTAAAQQGAQIARLPYALGCASPFACEITPLGGIWLTSNSEVWLFTDRYAPRNIGRPVQDILSSITPANLSLARMKYYHTSTRNWLALSIAANGANFNNTVLILDIDLLASNGSPSYFTFDMATNSPAWYVLQPGTLIAQTWTPRCDSMEAVYENGGIVRLLVGQTDLIQDIDYQTGVGTEITVPNGTITTHAWGNDSAFSVKRPAWIRFNTNRNPAVLAADGWSFIASGIDDDFYTFAAPLTLALTPGVNDSSTLGGNPDFYGGLAFRHSPELFRVGGVNFVAGRRLKFTVNFPSGTGVTYQFRGIQLGFGANPPN